MADKFKPDKREPMEDGQKLDLFKRELKSDADATENARESAYNDTIFVDSEGGHWDDDNTVFKERRVRLQIDMVAAFRDKYVGSYDEKAISVDYTPKAAGTSSDDCKLLDNLFRRDFSTDNSGDVAIKNAIRELATCGMGSLLMDPVFDDPEDQESADKVIGFFPINAAFNTVYWEQGSQWADKRDRDYCTLLWPFTTRRFKKKWPGIPPTSPFEPENYFDGRNTVNTGGDDTILVGIRYEKKFKREPVFHYYNILSEESVFYGSKEHKERESEFRANQELEFVEEKLTVTQTIEKTVFSGDRILEKTTPIIGKRIPIAMFYANHAIVNNVEYFRGLTRNLKDGQQVLDSQISKVQENAGRSDGEKPIMAPEQMEGDGIQEAWADSTNLSWLPAHPLYDKSTGALIAAGPIAFTKPAQSDQNTVGLIDMMTGYLQSATGTAFEDTVDPTTSGKHVEAKIKREREKTSNIDKAVDSGVKTMGDIYKDMAPIVYADVREVMGRNDDGSENIIKVNTPIMDKTAGRMVNSNRLGGKKFSCSANIGPRYESQQEEIVENMKGSMDSIKGSSLEPVLMPMLMATMSQNLTGAGYDPFKKWGRRTLLLMGAVDAQTPEEEQMLQQAQQQAQEPDEQAKLLEAAAMQQEAEARSLDASALQKTADASLKEAQTVETLAGIGIDQQKAANDAENSRGKLVNERVKMFADAQQKRIETQAKQGLG